MARSIKKPYTLRKSDFTAHYNLIHNKEPTSVLSILLQWQKDSLINQRCKQDCRTDGLWASELHGACKKWLCWKARLTFLPLGTSSRFMTLGAFIRGWSQRNKRRNILREEGCDLRCKEISHCWFNPRIPHLPLPVCLSAVHHGWESRFVHCLRGAWPYRPPRDWSRLLPVGTIPRWSHLWS